MLLVVVFSDKPFLKLLFSDQTVMQNFEDGVIKTEHFESRMGAKFKEWLRKQTNGEMCWWMIRTRGTKVRSSSSCCILVCCY